ncbi:MAG: hypothetical protein KBA87_06705 [Lachnospiraceae bacterium]|jgi:hypothetical protein|nr:hypothetical protein [Lachnospiraceae bacterium]
MIDFEKELENYKEKPLLSETEKNIKSRELTDLVDLLKTSDSNTSQKRNRR